MSKDLFNRYVWLIDTIRRHGTINRRELNNLWKQSGFSNGEPLPRRTFYNYRNAIEELFRINIECNPSTFEYFIADEADRHTQSVTDWMLNSAATSTALSNARDISERIFVEDVPSARSHLAPIIGALKGLHPIKFTYSPYSRVNPKRGVAVEPYFLKIFKQRWYVTGRNVADDVIKTYALDRMSDLTIGTETFVIPPDFDAEVFFRDSFGIVFTQGESKDVVLKVDARQAKYFRALPLHHSQRESMVNDGYSIFHYRLRLTPDLVQELMSYGPKVTVISPPELRAMVVSELTKAIENYSNEN